DLCPGGKIVGDRVALGDLALDHARVEEDVLGAVEGSYVAVRLAGQPELDEPSHRGAFWRKRSMSSWVFALRARSVAGWAGWSAGWTSGPALRGSSGTSESSRTMGWLIGPSSSGGWGSWSTRMRR